MISPVKCGSAATISSAWAMVASLDYVALRIIGPWQPPAQRHLIDFLRQPMNCTVFVARPAPRANAGGQRVERASVPGFFGVKHAARAGVARFVQIDPAGNLAAACFASHQLFRIRFWYLFRSGPNRAPRHGCPAIHPWRRRSKLSSR